MEDAILILAILLALVAVAAFMWWDATVLCVRARRWAFVEGWRAERDPVEQQAWENRADAIRAARRRSVRVEIVGHTAAFDAALEQTRKAIA